MKNIDLRAHFIAGYFQALNDYGIWKDGVQYIGCQGRPIHEVMKKFLEEMAANGVDGNGVDVNNEDMRIAMQFVKNWMEKNMPEVVKEWREHYEDDKGKKVESKSHVITSVINQLKEGDFMYCLTACNKDGEVVVARGLRDTKWFDMDMIMKILSTKNSNELKEIVMNCDEDKLASAIAVIHGMTKGEKEHYEGLERMDTQLCTRLKIGDIDE